MIKLLNLVGYPTRFNYVMDPCKKEYVIDKFMQIELDEEVTIADLLNKDYYDDVIEAIEHIISNVF